ncbi:MAG: DnaJ C-terminal domain-containing protein [candidate division Zixibacteria bacterium]|nr:DnaJ C-terminal domain-containing protein [candidate division Zixibacteria bacterium]
MGKTFYDILGVSENASVDEIKRSFRQLAKKYHPDRNRGDKTTETKFKEISEAYDTLSDKKKRQEYDTMRKYGAFAGTGNGGAGGGFPGGQGAGGANFNFSDLFRQGSGGRGGFQTFRFGGGNQGTNGFEDIISQFFGGAQGSSSNHFSRKRRARPTRGQDLTASLNISFMESVNGAKKILHIAQTNKKLAVKIPVGIESGGKIKLVGQGMPNPRCGPNPQGGRNPRGGHSGDLIITVFVMPDQNFKRKGNDVYTSVNITFKEAILGTQKQIKTLTKKVMLRIPAGTQPGTKMRLKGQGLAVKSRGDLYVTINIDIPKNITDEQRKILEEWG